MKRLLCLVAILATSFRLLAQDTSSAVATAARQDASRQASEERFKIMAADIATLNANNTALQESIVKLRAELERVRNEQASAAAAAKNNSVQESLNLLKTKIEEVDRKRESDKKAISEEIQKSIDKLGNMIKDSAAATARVRPPAHRDSGPVADKGFQYVVEANDTLSIIVKAYNAKFKEENIKGAITTQQVKDANPKVKWEKGLRTGQKLIIPDPSSLK